MVDGVVASELTTLSDCDLVAGRRRVVSTPAHALSMAETNAQIATILGAAPRALHEHLERIYDKLGVDTRTAAAMRALALGIVAQQPAPARN